MGQINLILTISTCKMGKINLEKNENYLEEWIDSNEKIAKINLENWPNQLGKQA